MTRSFILAALLAAPAARAEDAAKVYADWWAARMALSPLTATFTGVPGHDDKLDDIGPAGRAARKAALEASLKRVRALDRKKLGAEDKLSADVLRWTLETELAILALPFHELAVDHMDGGQAWIPTVVQIAQPMKDADDAARLEKRLRAVPDYFLRLRENLAAGLRSGRVSARVPAEKLLRQLEELSVSPFEKSPYDEAAGRLPETLRAEWRPKLEKAVDEAVRPALKDLAAFLKSDYLPKTRTENIGLGGVPGGKAMYRQMIRLHTTLDKSPDELHDIGLSELAGIREEMTQVARRAGKAGDVETFLEATREDPKNFFSTRDELKTAADALIAKIRTKLPDWFGTMPKTELVVKAVEEYKEKNEGAAFYFQPPTDLSRPGVYYINTYKPETRSRLSMTSLALHEALPGHHFQIALALENRALPDFRRNGDFTAYVEGWALYTERLGDEMGLYEDDLSRLGMLSDQALRASRLVVDTGLHAKGWTREKAIAFMKANTPMSQGEIEAEVDRYTVWPGQALAYKTGQREIAALREEVRARTGRRFDVKAFHDAVLRHGPLPLPVLRESVLEAFPAK